MKVRIIHSTFELKPNEKGMIIPCTNTANIFLAVSKETNNYIETNKCPICGKKIYLEASGWMGHYKLRGIYYMSHYAVLVLHKEDQNIDTLFAPYNENLKVEPYLKLTNDEVIARIKEEYDDYKNIPISFSDETEKELIKSYAEDYGYIVLDDGLYSTYNPNSKWDWYQIGGRFSSSLPLTNEALEKEYIKYINYPFTDIAPINYVNWKYKYLTEEEKNKIRRWWEINIYDAPLKKGEEKDKYLFYNPKYYERRYGDAETDIKIQETISFFAVITPDGKWHAPSNMGWWACTDGEPEDELKWDLEFYDRFIEPNLNSDLICTVVDCHI